MTGTTGGRWLIPRLAADVAGASRGGASGAHAAGAKAGAAAGAAPGPGAMASAAAPCWSRLGAPGLNGSAVAGGRQTRSSPGCALTTAMPRLSQPLPPPALLTPGCAPQGAGAGDTSSDPATAPAAGAPRACAAGGMGCAGAAAAGAGAGAPSGCGGSGVGAIGCTDVTVAVDQREVCRPADCLVALAGRRQAMRSPTRTRGMRGGGAGALPAGAAGGATTAGAAEGADMSRGPI
mmetsp:Transcript_5895/g.17204  ORF Transcript_5895/g.17204 Transcript_5895/m.17204 type:complete len:235 (+) Transcript_5895:689-1393(+)